MGIAPSRRGARQLVSHRHVTVNGDVVNCFYHLKPGDKVAVREKSKSLEAIERSLSNSSHVYEWITWNNDVKEVLSFLYQLDFKFQKTLKNN
jgi:small subunit ribosomal protein S4